MTNLDTTAVAEAPAPSTIVEIAVTKGKDVLTINLEDVPDDVYRAALVLGLKELVNKGMSKITAKDIPNEDARKAAAMAQAAKNVEAILDGTIKLPSKAAKAGKTSGAVTQEARRLAKAVIKDQIRAAGMKISHVDPKEITAAANELLKADPSYLKMAEASLEARSKLPATAINVKAIPISQKRVQQAEAKKAKAKKDAPLSAKQAGMPATRAKGEQPRAKAN